MARDSVFSAAKRRIDERRQEAQGEAAERRKAFFVLCPEYEEIEREVKRTGILITQAMFRGEHNIDRALAKIRENNLSQQRRMSELLAAFGYPADYLEPNYACKLCSDTGFIDGKACACLKQAMKLERFERLNAITPLELSTFDTFSLDLYPDADEGGKGISTRRLMQLTVSKCRSYASSFSPASPSLLLQGGVGLGKTHLSLAIAREVIDKGYGVLYGSAQNFFSKIEREHFNRSELDENTLEACNDCDLLILDDLGAEFSTQFTVAMLYDIVNTRLLRSRPTIISTNLDFSGLESRYSERVVSRIMGSYTRFQFVGKDLRIKLRKAKRG